MYVVETRMIGRGTLRVREFGWAVELALQDCDITGRNTNIWNDDTGRLTAVVMKDRTGFKIARYRENKETVYALSKDGKIGERL